MAQMLALRDHTIAAIARRLPLCSAMCLARTCRRLSSSLPAILSPCDDSTEPTRKYTLRDLEARHFSSMCKWMRAYNIMLTIYPDHVAALNGAAALFTRILRYAISTPPAANLRPTTGTELRIGIGGIPLYRPY